MLYYELYTHTHFRIYKRISIAISLKAQVNFWLKKPLGQLETLNTRLFFTIRICFLFVVFSQNKILFLISFLGGKNAFSILRNIHKTNNRFLSVYTNVHQPGFSHSAFCFFFIPSSLVICANTHSCLLWKSIFSCIVRVDANLNALCHIGS